MERSSEKLPSAWTSPVLKKKTREGVRVERSSEKLPSAWTSPVLKEQYNSVSKLAFEIVI